MNEDDQPAGNGLVAALIVLSPIIAGVIVEVLK